MCAHQLLWVWIALSNTRHDCATAHTVIQFELQQFICFWHFCAFQHRSHTNISLFPFVECHVWFHLCWFICCQFVSFFSIKQFLHLCFYYRIFDFVEQQLCFSKFCALFQEFDAAEVVPCKRLHAQHITQFFSREWQEWLERNCQVSRNLQTNMQDSSRTCHICFSQFPRLCICKIFITNTCQIHSLFLGIAETEIIQIRLYIGFHIGKLFQCFTVIVGQFAQCWHHSIEIFMCQHQSAFDKVTKDSHQLAVISCLEIFPCEVIILSFRCIGCQHIAQHVLFAWEFHQVFVQPNSPIARCRNLVAFEVKELVCRHIVWQDIRTISFQHRWEHDTVEHDIVFTNEVKHTC